MKPKRIQRKRTKGWRMPENTIYVGRPTKFGNPFNWKTMGRAEAVRKYRLWIQRLAYDYRNAPNPLELRGKSLACWCPLDQPCHADVLLELAND